MTYDPQNIFAKILRGEIPCHKLYENGYALAFHDINAKADVHVLVIPKGAYISFQDFVKNATADEVIGFWHAVYEVTALADVRKTGYRLVTNDGSNAHQEVPHFHVHILGGEPLGGMVGR